MKPNLGTVVGIDMGASHLHYALADLRGRIRHDATEKLRAEEGPRKIIGQIKAGITRIAAVGAQQAAPLRGIAIGVPSPVDADRRAVALAANLPGWKRVRLGHALEKEFCVPVAVENDANMAAIGEHWRGVARAVDNFVFIALGTGIGSGIFVDGKLYRGRSGAAGEVSHMTLEWQRWAEDFGDVGYFESHAAGLGIAREGRERLGLAAATWPKTLAEERDAYFVFELYRQGNPAARQVLEKAFTMVGVGIANIVAVLDPELIVIGGGVAKGAPRYLLETIKKVVRRILRKPPLIKLSSLKDKAQTYGAIFSALTVAQTSAPR